MVGVSKKIGRLSTVAALFLIGAGAHAENFPSKPVHILVPYAAGGAVDVLARTLGQSLAKTWASSPSLRTVPVPAGSSHRKH